MTHISTANILPNVPVELQGKTSIHDFLSIAAKLINDLNTLSIMVQVAQASHDQNLVKQRVGHFQHHLTTLALEDIGRIQVDYTGQLDLLQYQALVEKTEKKM